MRSRHDLTGMQFGRLTAVELVSVAGPSVWLCRCSCGRTTETRADGLLGGKSKSCGCLQAENRSQLTHGGARKGRQSPEYRAWRAAKTRCYNTKDKGYPNYGARGIRMCDRWRESFEAFIADMAPRPSEEYSLDRIDTNGNYEPANCRWATWIEQCRGRRRTVLVSHDGATRSLAEWAELSGIKIGTLWFRHKKGLPLLAPLAH